MCDNYNPLVSIIIPVYNGEKYLKEAIDSALSQTYQNIEVLIVNDGSIDSSEDIALSYGDKIRYIKKDNGGVATALNLGIKESKGEYISWLSHDDIYYPEKIEKQVNLLNGFEGHDRKNKIVFSHFDIVDTIHSKRFEARKLQNFTLEDPIYTYNMLEVFFTSKLNGCTLLFPKNIFNEIGYFNTELKTVQDYELFMRFFKSGIKYVYLEDILLTSRQHLEQDTQRLMPLHLKELDYLYKWAFDLFKDEFQKMPMWQFEYFLNFMKARTLDKVYAYMLSEWSNGDWNKNKPIIWMYWENKKGCLTPDSIRLCWKTVINHNRNDFQIKILTEDDVETYLPDINQDYKLFEQIAHKADYIRFNLLYKYGGIWLDSDTIIFRSLEDVKYKLKENNFLCSGYEHSDGKKFPLIGFLAANSGNKICENVIKEIDNSLFVKLKRGVNIKWDDQGWIVSKAINEVKETVYMYPVFSFSPYRIYETLDNIEFEYSQENIRDFLERTDIYAFAQALGNSARSPEFNTYTEEELLAYSGLIGDMFRLGYGLILPKDWEQGFKPERKINDKKLRFLQNLSDIKTDAEYLELCEAANVESFIKQLEDKYKKEKVLLYGASSLFECLISNYDLSNLNIIGVSDKSFDEESTKLGYRAIPVSKIKDENPSVILVTALSIKLIEDYLVGDLFKDYNQLPKIESLIAIDKVCWYN